METKISAYGGHDVFFEEETGYKTERFYIKIAGQDDLWAPTLKELKKKIDKMATLKTGRIVCWFDERGYDSVKYTKATVTSVADPEGKQVVISYAGGGHTKRYAKYTYPCTPSNDKLIARIHEIRAAIVKLEKEKTKIEEEKLESMEDVLAKKAEGSDARK